MEKGPIYSPEQPLLPPFERMRQGELYSIPTTGRPLIDLEANRQNGINGSVIARFELPSQNEVGENMIIEVVDFGRFNEDSYPSVIWDAGRDRPLPGWGVTNTRFGIDAVNFQPDDRPIGFGFLAQGETIIGRNEHYYANYLLGFTEQSHETQERLRVISREHLRFYVSDDQEIISVKDESLNGTSIILPTERETTGLRRHMVRALGALARTR